MPLLTLPLDEAGTLPVAVLCQRIAARLYASAQDEAGTVYHMTDRKARGPALARLARSSLLTERIAAELVARRDAEDARRRQEEATNRRPTEATARSG